MSYGPDPLQGFTFPEAFEHVITGRVGWKEVIRTSRDAHPTSRRLHFAAETITDNYNAEINRSCPDGYIYFIAPASMAQGTLRKNE